MKTSDLTGAALDWAVAKCEGVAFDIAPDGYYTYKPSTNWLHGGPIIERENIQVGPIPDIEGWYAYKVWGDMGDYTGPTPLIAAMRCFVASKCGESVSMPEELV